VWVLLCFGLRVKVNLKKVYRLMKLKGWMAYHRKVTLKPRVKYGGSIADRLNQTGMTHVYCGRG